MAISPPLPPDVNALPGQATVARSYQRAIVLLLAAIGLVFAAAEGVSRYVVPHISKIERRTETEYAGLFAPASRPEIAVLGNSLLLEGVDLPSLQNGLAEYSVRRWVVEQTNYLDWYYGLRRLYGEGLRAKTIILMLDAPQTISSAVRGDYFAYRMLKTSDWLAATRDAHLGPSESFSLLLGNISAMYGLRSETRKVVLGTLVPAIGDLRNLFVPPVNSQLERQKTVEIAAERLRRYDALVRSHGGQLIFVIPASLDPLKGSYMLEAASQDDAGIPVLLPLKASEVSAIDFRDAYHLNPAGAARFTRALIPMLRDKLRVPGR